MCFLLKLNFEDCIVHLDYVSSYRKLFCQEGEDEEAFGIEQFQHESAEHSYLYTCHWPSSQVLCPSMRKRLRQILLSLILLELVILLLKHKAFTCDFIWGVIPVQYLRTMLLILSFCKSSDTCVSNWGGLGQDLSSTVVGRLSRHLLKKQHLWVPRNILFSSHSASPRNINPLINLKW